jgi:hypothetical protein
MPEPANRTQKPYTMAGAGPLVSAIWKLGDDDAGWNFRFNIYRVTPSTGDVSQLFQPEDLPHLAKLCRVLALILAEDASIPAPLRAELDELNHRLDSSFVEDY